MDTFAYERSLKEQGFLHIAGVDEAGRGPLAGPVVAGCVIFSSHCATHLYQDSKKITARQRDILFEKLHNSEAALGVGIADPAEIDRINILQATLLGMSRAVKRLSIPPDFLLIDGITPVPLGIEQKTLKKGDSRSLSIAAASVIAKVVRDRIMVAYDRLFPEYGFSGHKGYGSQKHRDAVALHGPCVCHRRTFAGVREHSETP